MNPIIDFNVISKALTQHPNSLMKLEFDVNSGADATVYVQLHDFPTAADLIAGNTAPAPDSVPIKSWPTPAGAIDVYKEFKNGELNFSNGIFVCVSTTQATLTLGTGNNKFDSIAGEVWNPEVSGTTRTQATVANGNGFTVWNDTGTGPANRLMRVVTNQTGGATVYLMLFAHLPNEGESPLRQWVVNNNATVDADFGSPWFQATTGLTLMQQTSNLVNHVGCRFQWSSTPTILTSVNTAFTYFFEYKSL